MDFSQVWPPWNRLLMKYPLLYLVYRIKTLHYMPPPHLLTHVCVYVCVHVCTFPLLLKELKLHLWLEWNLGNTHSSPSRSLHHSFLSSLSHAITLSISPYTFIHLFVSVHDLPVHCTPLFFYIQYRNFPPCTAPTSFPSFLLFSPTNHFHRSPPPPFHSLTIYSRPSTPVITLRKSQSRDCVMLRWVPVEVFIEMGLYRDWSCLRFPCTKTAIQTLFPLSRDPLSWAQCILFHGGLVILQRCAIIGICPGAQCVYACLCLWKWDRMREISSKSEVQLSFDLELFFVCLSCFPIIL